VHDAKPTVCALFPLGRAAKTPANGETDKMPQNIRPVYFVQQTTCGSKTHTHTLRDWLDRFGIPAEDEFYEIWTRTVLSLNNFFIECEKHKISDYTKDMFRHVAFSVLYAEYSAESDFLPQFKSAASKLNGLLDEIKARTKNTMGGAPDGEGRRES
jgi:hypothetical protein